MKYAMFTKKSTTKIIESFELELRKSVIKSIDKHDHRPSSIGSGCKSPYG